nr:hypothetical protein CFP56_31090 [Quercus suber]
MSRALLFKECLDSCGMIDLSFHGARYTWVNKQEVGFVIQEWLDKAFANCAWSKLYPEANMQHLTRIHSDHCPILLSFVNPPELHLPRPFRFQQFWLSHPQFGKLQSDNWLEHYELDANLQNFTEVVKIWNKEVFGNIFQRKARIEARLNGIQKALANGPSSFLLNLEKQLREDYWEVSHEEEELWSIKSREEEITVLLREGYCTLFETSHVSESVGCYDESSCFLSMGKQLSVILWLIVIHLLFSTGYGDYGRTPTGTGSSSGGFNSEEASRDAYAALKSNRFPDSSALRRSDRVDVDVDSDSIPEFNEPVGLQAEAQDGGVMMLPNFNGERDDENSEVYVEVRRLRFSSGAHDVVTYGILSKLLAVSHSEVPGLESGSRRLSLSSGALDVVPCGIWSSLWAVTDSEVPDLESGSRRWSTPGASTSSQVARSSNQRPIELGFAILLGSITAVVSIGVG